MHSASETQLLNEITACSLVLLFQIVENKSESLELPTTYTVNYFIMILQPICFNLERQEQNKHKYNQNNLHKHAQDLKYHYQRSHPVKPPT